MGLGGHMLCGEKNHVTCLIKFGPHTHVGFSFLLGQEAGVEWEGRDGDLRLKTLFFC